MLYTLQGPLRYFSAEKNYRLVVEGDRSLAAYYRALIPKWFNINSPRYSPHITVVRWGVETPLLNYWGKHEGQVVEYQYDSIIREGALYFWLDIFSTQLEAIRGELGLPIESRFGTPPEGFKKFFHMTLANKK
jgi:hypothetical protein